MVRGLNKGLPGKLQGKAPNGQGLSHVSAILSAMLTLDRITLFYHDLREASQVQSDEPNDNVADWAATIPTKDLRTTKTTAASRSLIGSSERTQSSTAAASSSGRSAVGGNVSLKPAKYGKGEAGGHSDNDEEDMGQTTTKRKSRNSSSVSHGTIFSLELSHGVYRLPSQVKRHANESRMKICLRRLFSIMHGVTGSYQRYFSGRGPNLIHGSWAISTFAIPLCLLGRQSTAT